MSCLFNSLSFFIKDLNAYSLRQIIADYIKNDSVLFDNLSISKLISIDPSSFYNCTSLSQYVDLIKKESTWGGALEIYIFCEIFNVNVNVHISNQNKPIQFKSSTLSTTTFNIYYTGNHYEPIKSLHFFKNL